MATNVENLSDGFKNIFLAGIGAMAMGAEKSKELVETLVSKGELTVEQGKDINSELTHRAQEATETIREGSLEAFMKTLSPEQREEFAAKAAEYAAKENAKSDSKSGEGEAEVVEVETAEADVEADAEADAAAEEAAE